jgi:long-subunit fatty acid transport protein
LSLSLNYNYRLNDKIFRGDSIVANPQDIHVEFNRITLSANYKVNEEWTLSAGIPYLEATRSERGIPNNNLSGLADINLGATFSPWKNDDNRLSNLSFNLGLMVPSGKAKDNPTTGVTAPSVFQLGTGSTQLALGAGYYGSLTEKFNYFSNLSVTVPLYESRKEFLPAETFSFRTGVGYAISDKWSSKLSLDLFHGEKDEFLGNEIPNTGSTTLSITSAIIYEINENVSASFSASIPIYRRVNETALSINTLWSAGVSFQF